MILVEENNVDVLDRSVPPRTLSMHITTRVVSLISKLKKNKKKKEHQEILILNEKKKKKQLNIKKKSIDLARLCIQTNKRESMHTTNELENIRQRILESINRSSKKTLKRHHRQESNVSVSSVSSVSSTETMNGGFEFVESRGEWSMIYDELTGATVFFNEATGKLSEYHPSGWVKMLVGRLSGR